MKVDRSAARHAHVAIIRVIYCSLMRGEFCILPAWRAKRD